MSIKLICEVQNPNSSVTRLEELDIEGLEKKKNIDKHQELLAQAYTHKDGKTYITYTCSCRKQNSVRMTIVFSKKKKKYHLRNFEANDHHKNCPLYLKRRHRDESGRIEALGHAPFRLPTEDSTHQSNSNYDEAEHMYSAITRVNSKRVSAFDSLMYSTIDTATIMMNNHNIYNNSTFVRYVLGGFFDLQMFKNSKESYKQYNDRLPEEERSYIEIGYLNEKKLEIIKTEFDEESNKYIPKLLDETVEKHIINDEFIDNISSENFKVINMLTSYMKDDVFEQKTTPDLYPLVLKESLQSIRNFDNFTDGQYLFLAIKVKLDQTDSYKTTTKFFLQPIYKSERFILPVESGLERDCIAYLESKLDDMKLYKPLTLVPELFFKNLKNFLKDHSELYKFYKNQCGNYNKKKVIRPDLFLLFDGQLYVFEFAGYMNIIAYKNRLEKKEKEFYKHFKKVIRYVRMEKINNKIVKTTPKL